MKIKPWVIGATLFALIQAASPYVNAGNSLPAQENLWVEKEEARICRLMGGALQNVPDQPKCKLPGSGSSSPDLETFCRSLAGTWNLEKKTCALRPADTTAAAAEYVGEQLNYYKSKDLLCSDQHFLSAIWDDDDNFNDVDAFKCSAPGFGLKWSTPRKALAGTFSTKQLGGASGPELIEGPPILAFGPNRGKDDPALSSTQNPSITQAIRKGARCDASNGEVIVGMSSVSGNFKTLSAVICGKFESATRKMRVGTSCHFLRNKRRDGGPAHIHARWHYSCREGFAAVGYFDNGDNSPRFDVDTMECCPYTIEDK